VMMSIEDSRLNRIAAFARANGLKWAAELGFNFVLPFAIYSAASGRIGAAPGLLAASIPPILWSLATFIRQRTVDAISMLVLAGIALSLIAFAGGGGVKFLQLRENLVGGVVAMVFLGSVAIGRPLIFQLAKAGSRRRGAQAAAMVEALQDDAGFRRAMTTATLAWGVGLAAACAINCTLVFLLTVKQFMLISGPISWATLGLLTLWTYRFVPRALREAYERRAGA
jgi:hypothetical protein